MRRAPWSALLAVTAFALAPPAAGATLRPDPVPLTGCQTPASAGMSWGNGRGWNSAADRTYVICDDGAPLGNGFRRDTIRVYDAANVWVDTIVTPFEAIFSVAATSPGSLYVAANASPTDTTQTGIVRRMVQTDGVWAVDPAFALRNPDDTPSTVRGRAIAVSFPDRVWVADAAFARRLSDDSGGAYGNDAIHVFEGSTGRRLAQVATTTLEGNAPRTPGVLGQGSVTDIAVDFAANVLVATESRGSDVRVHVFQDPDPELGHDPVPVRALGAAGPVDCASVGGAIGASYGVRITDPPVGTPEIHVLDTTCGAVRTYELDGDPLATTPIGAFPTAGLKPHGFATSSNGSFFLPQGMQRVGWPTTVPLSDPMVFGGGGGAPDDQAFNGATCTRLGDAALADDLTVPASGVGCGRGGDDVLRPSTVGSTILDGGPGTDVVSLAAAPWPVVLNLFNQDAFSDAPGAGAFYSVFGTAAARTVEGVIGGPFADVVTGSDGPDRIAGGGARDTINARAGDDVIDVRDGGPDDVVCGAGADSVTADAAGVDVLTGCETVTFAAPAPGGTDPDPTPGGGGTTPDPGTTPTPGTTPAPGTSPGPVPGAPGTGTPVPPAAGPTDAAGRGALTSALRTAATPLRGLRSARARAVLPVRLLEAGRATVALRARVGRRTVTMATGSARRTSPGTVRVTVRRTRAGRVYWQRRGVLRPTVRVDVTRPGRPSLRVQRVVRLR